MQDEYCVNDDAEWVGNRFNDSQWPSHTKTESIGGAE